MKILIDLTCILVMSELKRELDYRIETYVDSLENDEEVELQEYYKNEFPKDIFSVNAYLVEPFVSDIEDWLRDNNDLRSSLFNAVKHFYVVTKIATPFDEEAWDRGEHCCTGGKKSVIWFTYDKVKYMFNERLLENEETT